MIQSFVFYVVIQNSSSIGKLKRKFKIAKSFTSLSQNSTALKAKLYSNDSVFLTSELTEHISA